MIKLRLQRKGRKKRPFYHIVVADSRSPRDGRIIERVGRYDNVSEHKELTLDTERVMHWLKIGAQPSDTVRSILKSEGILYRMHLVRWGKSEEEIESALAEWKKAREAKSSEKDASRKAQQKELLKAEEQEFKKQLEEKAAVAAKALEKKKEEEAKAAAEAEAGVAEVPAVEATEEATAPDESEPVEAETADATAEEVAAEESPEEETAEVTEEPESEPAGEETAVEEEPVTEEKSEEPAVEVEEAPAKAEEVVAETEAAPAEKEEAPAEEPAKVAEPTQLSTDMTASDAIAHIKDHTVEELKGFVPENEGRVTVLRAWESKQQE